jgi:LmbE family N-acetylglucosaminyl deacetylase
MLCVFAHPDDECLGPGGTIAHYAKDGVDVHILMFTCGEAGSIGVSRELPSDELCRLRVDELARSCDVLGVKRHRIVGAPDKKVAAMPFAQGVAEVQKEIEALRPHVALTFHHGGVSGHPDHIAVAGFLDAAVDRSAAAGGGPARYYQWGIPRELMDLYDRPNLVPMEDDEIAAVIDIPDDAMDRKIAAIECHETQIEFYRGLTEKFDYRSVAGREYFSLRRPRGPRSDVVQDLFSEV